MTLVADRFIVEGADHVFDLATGLRVVLVTAPIAADTDELAWAGEFLRSVNLDIRDADLCVCTRHASPVVIPPTGVWAMALAWEPEPHLLDLPLPNRGVLFVRRRAIVALGEMFGELSGPRLRAAALWGPRRAGKARIVSALVRLARLRGFVPVCTRFADSLRREGLRGRSLFVIDQEDGGSWRAIVQAAIQSPVPHALLSVGQGEVPGVDGMAVSPLKIEDLVDAIVPRGMSSTSSAEVQRAAEESRGWPGRFIDARSGHLAMKPPRRRPVAARCVADASRCVAEEPAVYGGDDRPTPARATPDGATPAGEWPLPGELSALRRRVASALGDLDRGRHAHGIRGLRQAIAGLDRRRAWNDAADAGLALAAALLERGAARDAQRALADAHTCASRNHRHLVLVDVAILNGEAWIDLARLDEAESVLVAARTSATALCDSGRAARASIGLARCLFWRGRYEEARSAVERDLPDVPHGIRVRRACWEARIACAARDGAGALAILARLTDGVPAATTARIRAAVRMAEAWVRLGIGDAGGAVAAAEAAIRDADEARSPLRALRARLILAEAERRLGRAASALGRLQRLDRRRKVLPPIVAARLKLLLRLAKDGDLETAAHVAEAGLPGLAQLAPPARTTNSAVPSLEPIVDEVIAIVRACQTAEDDVVVLKDVCARMRRQLHAATVTFVGVESTETSAPLAGDQNVIVLDGARMDLEIAERAMEAGILIAPHRRSDRVEAATAIQYAGATIGALCVRWSLGSTHDHSQAAAMLATAGVVAAPFLWAATRRRDRLPATAPDILGVTPVIADLRRHVDRAAAAPYPVLIQGESGSGKELVARAIHRHSRRRERPFRTLNCAAIPDDLADAELFGHVRGAFTGAVADRAGVLEEAHGGTLLLDEVGELTARTQAKLLRVLQEAEIRRVGENLSRRIDVRIIAATNRDLAVDVEHGRFRADLLYRLDVIRIVTPPLRQRMDDIALLVDHYWRDAANRIGSRATLATATIAALARYHWPGNVRELQNVLAALAVRCARRGVVPPSALPPQFETNAPSAAGRLHEARRAFEHRFVRAALVRSGGHRGRAALELGVTRQGLTKLMMRLGIS